MGTVIPGHATADGTARYAARFADRLPAGHFRRLDTLQVSSLGIGTYLGREDDATDAQYRRAVAHAVERGVNVIDTAVNYRHQRSERAVGAALADAIARGVVRRDEVVVATKGGYLAFDGAVPPDPRAYFAETYVRPGIVRPGDAVGWHCMTPRYLADQIERSRANLGLETIDIYYLHNPESQLEEIDAPTLLRRVREAFAALEAAVAAGKIRMYGTATWNGYRAGPEERGYLSLADVVEQARAAAGEAHHFRVVQLPFNLAMTEALTRANQRLPDGVFSALDAARRLGLYTMASVPVFQGRLTRDLPSALAELVPGLGTDAQRALQFVRSTPGIGTALVGMKSLPHVEENVGVAAAPPLAPEQVARLFQGA
ncbi:MAG TPA: aldo/keto reductase [Candidatus Tectomicrobia bacterium]|nr:aldo/keto reductase [Candidatus Tectomicrobia bacterium]